VIDSRLLTHLSPRLTVLEAQDIADAFNAVVDRYEIDNNRRVAAAMGQCCHESAGFMVMEENLNYRAATLLKMFPYSSRRTWGFTDLNDASNTVADGPKRIANRIYGSRMGNNPNSDDGYDFRGSGYIQLTGYEAFKAYEEESGEIIVDRPDKIRELPLGAMSALWVFAVFKKCNPLADDWKIETIGGRINGKTPPYGAEERLMLSNKALDWLEGQ
jgi:putative chitinase